MSSYAIDARMLFSSGIGTMLQNTIKRLAAPPQVAIVAGGAQQEWMRHHAPAIDARVQAIKLYSVKEQLAMPGKVSDCSLLWVPHYNASLFYKLPLVVTVHDLFYLANPDLVRGLKRAYARILFQFIAKNARQIICVSEFTATEMVRYTGCSRKKISVIYNGVDESWFTQEPPGQVEQPYFLFVGNVKPHKNLKRFLEAFDSIKTEIPHKVIIVGRKEGFIISDPEVMKYAKTLGERILFTGWIDNAKLREYVANAAALVFPSLYEGFGLPPLEAMAAGCPVLAANAASIPEICGDAAIYFNPYDVRDIAETLRRFARLEKDAVLDFISRGRDRARAFKWDDATKSIEAVIGNVERTI